MCFPIKTYGRKDHYKRKNQNDKIFDGIFGDGMEDLASDQEADITEVVNFQWGNIGEKTLFYQEN